MKKSILISAALLALAMLASCQKELLIETPTATKGVTEFTASIEQPTRTAIDATGKVTWVAGDEITVTDAAKSSAVYVAESSGASTKFTLKTGETAVGDGPYTATYGDITKQVYDAAGANCPLTASTGDATTTDFTFSSPYAVVEITAKSSNAEVIKSVSVSYGTNTSTLDCGDGVTLTTTGNDFYVAVVPATDAALSVTFYTTNMMATKERTDAITLAAKDLLAVTLTFAEDDWNVATLPGEFSVGAAKKVKFSKGNLYWDGDSYEFEDNQYTIGTWNAENHVNYFFWSNNPSVATAESYSDETAAEDDVFFTNDTAETAKSDFTVNGVTGMFRTLSADEWTYILSTRPDAADLLVEDVTVCGVEHCLIIAPDTCLNGYVFDKTKKSYDAAAWAAAETAGLVCLPPAGYRDGTDVESEDGNGFYWSSTTDAAETASNLGFKKSDN